MARLLIADDDPMVRRFFAEVAALGGHEVVLAGDGDEALAVYEQAGADLAIVDLVMPRRDGISTIAELRRRSPDLKIIAVSGGWAMTRHERDQGADESGALRDAERAGADLTLRKPVAPSALLQAVQGLLSGS